MSTSALPLPVTPRKSSLPNTVPHTSSPSQELALSLAGIKLDDVDDEEEDEADPLSSKLALISTKLSQVRDHFFVIQERRHAGVFAFADKSRGHRTDGSRQESEDKSVALDESMAHLNSLLEMVSEEMKHADTLLNKAKFGDAAKPVIPQRRGSNGSIRSLDSFDDAFLELDVGTSRPASLKKRFDDLSIEWENVQAEARALEEELSGDKYLIVFTSIGEQMEDMMDSLDKALASCHDFIFSLHRERAERALDGVQAMSISQLPDREERLSELKLLKRSFEVKRTSYGPACEQMFGSLERGVGQRSTQNGTILRRLSELKTRWRSLRERVVKMDRDLKKIEADLTQSPLSPPSSSRHLLPTSTPPRSVARPKSQLRDKNDSATKTPTSMHRSISINDLNAEQEESLSPSTNRSHLSRSPGDGLLLSITTPPAKPPKSTYRRSVVEGRSVSDQYQNLSLANAAQAQSALQSSRRANIHPSPSASAAGSGVNAKRTSALYTSKDRYARAGSEPPAAARKTTTAQRQDKLQQMEGEVHGVMESLVDINDQSFASADTAHNRPASAAGIYPRPPSASGSYYRPPSASGHRSDANGPASRIPRLSTGPSSRTANDFSSAASSAGDRPGSAMSFASSTGYARSPSAKLGGYRNQPCPPSSFRNSHNHYNRLSMQTPEPMIAARAQRMSLFAPKPSATSSTTATPPKRSSRPPPARYNAALYSGSGHQTNASSNSHRPSGSVSSAKSASPSAHNRTLQLTQPLVINKRNSSAAWAEPGGRATPLSAAALAKVPHGGPDLGEHINRPYASSVTESMANIRPNRGAGDTSFVARSYTPSVMSGRDTPTFSETGASIVWGAGTSRLRAATYTYRPNPNDAIDVEVAAIVNSLGISIERVDPPLPKGVKELTPSSTKTVRYEVGGKTITCKLLQLHRPASMTSEKTSKVLTRVGGGWVELRQHLLTRLGTA